MTKQHKTVNIIGAGIAGLSAGCYLQMNGYRTRIFELHDQPGGLCTAWQRKGYTLDGCIHWLVGSSPASAFYRVWDELVDMASFTWVNHELMTDIELQSAAPDGSHTFHLYARLDRLEAYMKQLSPADSRVIESFVGVARALQRDDLPPLIERAPELWTGREKLGLLRLLPLMLRIRRWSKVTNTRLARRFKSPFLREAMELLFDGRETGVLMIAMPLAFYDLEAAGYPIGGSLPFARAIERRYLELGGEIEYGARVARIVVEDDAARGVTLADGQTHRAELVVSAADGHFTIFEALRGLYTDRATREWYQGRRLPTFPSMLLVSLGVARTFEGQPHLQRFRLPRPWTLPDGTVVERLGCHIYNYDPTLAPAGKTVLNATITTREHGYWQRLRREDRRAYRAAKEELARRVVAVFDERLGGIEEQLEVQDVATPATIIRYTNNWQGSFEGWLPSDFVSAKPLPKELPGLRDFFMVGQWVEPGGGLPPALLSGRNVAQIICHRDGRAFTVAARPRGRFARSAEVLAEAAQTAR